MSEGKRVVRGIGNQKPDTAVQPAASGTGNEILQKHLPSPARRLPDRSAESSSASDIFSYKSCVGSKQPDHAAASEQRSLRHQKIQRLTLRCRNERQKRHDQPQEESTQKANVLLKQSEEYQHTGDYADDLSCTQLNKIGKRRPPDSWLFAKQSAERIQKTIIEAENECDRPAANAVNAVCQSHAEAVFQSMPPCGGRQPFCLNTFEPEKWLRRSGMSSPYIQTDIDKK